MVRVDQVSVAVLGLLTICAYGNWYYAFGVLLDPIRADTGWSESSLALAFSAGIVVVGVLALSAGRVLDRVGHRRVFLLGAIAGTAGMLAASAASSPTAFLVASALGSGVIGACGFYPVTMTTAVRLNPLVPERAIATLTLWGAFSSVVYLPLVSWLEGELGWRASIRLLTLVTAAAFLAAALLPDRGSPERGESAPPLRDAIGLVVRTRASVLFVLAMAFAGIAQATILVYQVPLLTAAGLSAGTAATIAGLRGLCQLTGRVPLNPLVAKFGVDGVLVASVAAVGISGLLALRAGSIPIALGFALIAGFGMGAFNPVTGMKTEHLFPRNTLGATMGVIGSITLLAGAIGPVLTGWLIDANGDRRWAVVVIVVASTCATGAVLRLRHLTADLAESGPEVATDASNPTLR